MMKLDTDLRPFQSTLACWLGLNEALVLQHLHTLIMETESSFADGQVWIARTLTGLASDFFFWDAGVIKRTVNNLKADGLLKVRLDSDSTGRFTWYTIDYATLSLLTGPVSRLQDKIKKRRKARDSRSLDNRPGFVYLCNSPDRIGYKIGLSVNAAVRMTQLGTKLIHVIPTDDMLQTELLLHGSYDHKRLDGEWFDLDSNDLESIKAISEIRLS